MTFAAGAGGLANQPHQGIAGLVGIGSGAGLIGAAGAIDFPRGDPGDPDMGAFSAPYGAIAIPDADWGATE